mmetsp:Transcript_18732/g.43366  ORF Transcript_18732/g.43366 Transcript_18732/m.43366 type:complete len:975 (-) Transcript_18732:205-3129(-)
MPKAVQQKWREHQQQRLLSNSDDDNNNNVDENRLNVEGPVPKCEFISLLPFSSDLEKLSYGIALGIELAIRHLNDGDGSIVSELPSLRKTCPISFSTIFADSHRNPNHGFAVIDRLTRPNSNTTVDDKPFVPCAVVGAVDSRVTRATALVTGLRGIPQISMASTSNDLNDAQEYSLFGRTIPDHGFESEAFVRFLHDTLEIRNFFVIFKSAPYTRSIVTELQDAIRKLGWAPGQRNEDENENTMYMLTHMYEFDDDEILKDAVEALKQSQYRFVLALPVGDDIYDKLMTIAYEEGVAGNGEYHWWFFEGVRVALRNNREFEYPGDSILVEAYEGAGHIEPTIDTERSKFAEFERQSLDLQRQLYLEYGGEDAEPTNSNSNGRLVTGWRELIERKNESDWWVGISYSGYGYDAMVLLAMSACHELAESTGPPGNNDNELPYLSGNDLFNRTLSTNFTGVTGDVVLDSTSGSRKGDTIEYTITNWRASSDGNDTNSSIVMFEPTVTHTYLPPPTEDWNSLQPFYYNGGQTVLGPDPDLPRVEVTHTVAHRWVIYLAWILAITILSATLGFSIWTCRNSKARVVRASQPAFLYLLNVGVAFMGLSIIPISLEHIGTAQTNAYCISFLWLFFTGFGITFSALFAKTRRINKIIQSAKSFRRITLSVRETIFPVAFVFAYNVIVLIFMTIYGQPVHEKSDLKLDIFDRPIETKTQCTYKKTSPFIYALIIGNMAMVGFAIFQAWVARHLSTEFAESKNIMYALLISFIVTIVVIPVSLLTEENPTVDTFVTVLMTFVISSDALLFIFLPKVQMVYKLQQEGTSSKLHFSGFSVRTGSSGTTSGSADGDRILTTKPSVELTVEIKSLQRNLKSLKRKERSFEENEKTLQQKNDALRKLLVELSCIGDETELDVWIESRCGLDAAILQNQGDGRTKMVSISEGDVKSEMPDETVAFEKTSTTSITSLLFQPEEVSQLYDDE